MTLIELGLIVGSVAVLPFGGPMGFGFALGGSAVVARAIRRARRPRPVLDAAERLRRLRERRIPDDYLLFEVGDYVLIEAIDHARYRAVPKDTLDDERSVIATLCLHGDEHEVERQLLPWTSVPDGLFHGFAGKGRTPQGTSIVLFHEVYGRCLEDVLPLPRERFGPFFSRLLEALCACERQGVVLTSIPAGRLKLNGPTLMFAWKEPFDGRRCMVDPMIHFADFSPEQIIGTSNGPAQTQFQLGLLLYQALTGRHPFSDGADSLASIMAMISNEPAPLEIGEPALEAFVLRLLAKDPAERFPSMAAARDAFLSSIPPS